MKRVAIFSCCLIALSALVLGWGLVATINAPATISKVSPQGGYLIESVPVDALLAPTGGLSYLRIVDRQNPQQVYRSPLYWRSSVDIRIVEDERSLGVTWIEFDKHERRFTLSIPQWRRDWRSSLISNTPYDVVPNG